MPGNEKLMSENKIDVSSLSSCAKELAGKGKTVMYFACGGKFYGLIAVADKVKPTSKEAVQALKKSGIEVIMLTGDNAVTAAAIKNEVGIDRVEAEVMPADKQRIVSELKNAGKKVVMVGDGINDSPRAYAGGRGDCYRQRHGYSNRVRRRCAYEKRFDGCFARDKLFQAHDKKHKTKSVLGVLLQRAGHTSCSRRALPLVADYA